mmetsp:Transcript_25039/g.58362  ORF Transcript_25039/g.58362 Transcript_25039/m.58362 type:complete len:243 (-) Transcript_25039:2109-2837(-)
MAATCVRRKPSALLVCFSASLPTICNPNRRICTRLSAMTGSSAWICCSVSAEAARERSCCGCVSPRKKATSLRMDVTTCWSLVESGGESAGTSCLMRGGAGSDSRESVDASSYAASRESASAAATTSSSKKARKRSPSDEKKNCSASRARLASAAESACSVSLLPSAASARLPMSKDSSDATSAGGTWRVPTMLPAEPKSTKPRTPLTLNAVPSPLSFTATNFSSACSMSIIRSTSKELVLP